MKHIIVLQIVLFALVLSACAVPTSGEYWQKWHTRVEYVVPPERNQGRVGCKQTGRVTYSHSLGPPGSITVRGHAWNPDFAEVSFNLHIRIQGGLTVQFHSREFLAKDLDSGKEYSASIERIQASINSGKRGLRIGGNAFDELDVDFLDPMVGDTYVYPKYFSWGGRGDLKAYNEYQVEYIFSDFKSSDFELRLPDYSVNDRLNSVPPLRFMTVFGDHSSSLICDEG